MCVRVHACAYAPGLDDARPTSDDDEQLRLRDREAAAKGGLYVRAAIHSLALQIRAFVRYHLLMASSALSDQGRNGPGA